MAEVMFVALVHAVVEMQSLASKSDIIIDNKPITEQEEHRAANEMCIILHACIMEHRSHTCTLHYILDQHTYLVGIVRGLIKTDTERNKDRGDAWLKSIIYPLEQTLSLLNRLAATHSSKYNKRLFSTLQNE
jgi:hypothetical protein